VSNAQESRGPAGGPRIVAVTGNPRPDSRTHGLARTLAASLAAVLPDAVVGDVDLAGLGGQVLDPGDAAATAATDQVLAADVLVIAWRPRSPSSARSPRPGRRRTGPRCCPRFRPP
jgi:hypothetical protein